MIKIKSMKYLILFIVLSSFCQNKIDGQRIIKYSDKNFNYLLALDTSYDSNLDSTIKSITIQDLKTKKVVQKIIIEENEFKRAGNGGFIIEDMNFDGYNDFRLCSIRGNHATAYYYWIYNQSLKKFSRDTLMEVISSPYFDQKKRRIEVGWHVSGTFGSETYKWVNKKVVCIFQKEDSPIYYRDDEANNTDDDGNRKAKFRIITINKLVNDKLKEVFRKEYTEKEYANLDYKSLPQPD